MARRIFGVNQCLESSSVISKFSSFPNAEYAFFASLKASRAPCRVRYSSRETNVINVGFGALTSRRSSKVIPFSTPCKNSASASWAPFVSSCLLDAVDQLQGTDTLTLSSNAEIYAVIVPPPEKPVTPILSGSTSFRDNKIINCPYPFPYKIPGSGRT